MGEERFIADAMLGKLTKWLRVMGVDVKYDPWMSDSQLLRAAAEERRILLTRDRRLIRRRGPGNRFLIESDYYHEQVRQVVRTFDLERGTHLLTRCLRCNTPLQEISKCAATSRVPAYVSATQTVFKRCLSCDRVYWSGTHRDNMLRQLDAILAGGVSTPAGESPFIPSRSEEERGSDECDHANCRIDT
jgi:uncharacterized protein with PIN domain